MDPPAGKSLRRENQGCRPASLKVRKDSHKIKKPLTVSPPPRQEPSRHHECLPGLAPLQVREDSPMAPPRQEPSHHRRHPPVVICEDPPEVIHVNHKDFKEVVQRLPGLSSTDSSSSSSKYPSFTGGLSPGARFVFNHQRIDITTIGGVEMMRTEALGNPSLFPGTLSSGLALPAIPSSFFSPPWDPNPSSFPYVLSPLLKRNNNNLVEGNFMPSPILRPVPLLPGLAPLPGTAASSFSSPLDPSSLSFPRDLSPLLQGNNSNLVKGNFMPNPILCPVPLPLGLAPLPGIASSSFSPPSDPSPLSFPRNLSPLRQGNNNNLVDGSFTPSPILCPVPLPPGLASLPGIAASYFSPPSDPSPLSFPRDLSPLLQGSNNSLVEGSFMPSPILCPVPLPPGLAPLPGIAASSFSPPSDSSPLSFPCDLSPLLQGNNNNLVEGSFMPSPSLCPGILSPSPASLPAAQASFFYPPSDPLSLSHNWSPLLQGNNMNLEGSFMPNPPLQDNNNNFVEDSLMPRPSFLPPQIVSPNNPLLDSSNNIFDSSGFFSLEKQDMLL
ncbi:hypothetical protein NMG60_11032900 [Bertholletia excelsa]